MSAFSIFARRQFSSLSRAVLSPSASPTTRYMGGIPAKVPAFWTTEPPKTTELPADTAKEFATEQEFENEWKRHTFTDYRLSDEDLIHEHVESDSAAIGAKFRGPAAYAE